MGNLILCLIIFAIAFIGRLLLYFITRKKENKKRYGISMEIQYLVSRFNLDKKKLNNTNIAAIMSLLDALIISITLFISVSITSNVMLEMLIGLVIVVVLILIVNEIFGRILLKKGYGRK